MEESSQMLFNVLLDVKANEEYPAETQGSSGMLILSPLVVAVLSLLTMPESDLECAVWFELWHPLWPYGRAQVGSKFLLSPEV